jgi:hypothetical protein
LSQAFFDFGDKTESLDDISDGRLIRQRLHGSNRALFRSGRHGAILPSSSEQLAAVPLRDIEKPDVQSPGTPGL